MAFKIVAFGRTILTFAWKVWWKQLQNFYIVADTAA